MTTKAFRAALCINSSNVYTIGEARSRLYRRFCIICCVLFSVDLFHLISTTVSNNRFYFWGAPLQQQTELQLLFGCCQQQAERLVVIIINAQLCVFAFYYLFSTLTSVTVRTKNEEVQIKLFFFSLSSVYGSKFLLHSCTAVPLGNRRLSYFPFFRNNMK